MSRYLPRSLSLPMLPLLLWDTPAGLDLALAQEGVAFRKLRHFHPLAFQGGRFVLYDSKVVTAATVQSALSHDHVAIDIDRLRGGEAIDPFVALVDTRAALGRWDVAGFGLVERVARYDKAPIRRRMIAHLMAEIAGAGGVWARLAPFPFPLRSAFNFRVDLDETDVDDYDRFARARRPLADCTTHFVSTRAYGDEPRVLDDLLRFDTQSHGHHHVVYRDREANRRNLRRAHEILRFAEFEVSGFAAPHGRWNLGLDRVLEDFGYLYSSDFQLNYDDLPFFPWRGDRFSQVLQVPVHPVCEGLFLDAGRATGSQIAAYLASVVRAKLDAGEPAFVYGHPERRLARHPEILEALAREIEGEALVWRVSLSEFAYWWRWRHKRSWSLVSETDGRLEVQLDDWSTEFPLGLEIFRGRHVCRIPITHSRTTVRLDDLAYERVAPGAAIARPRRVAPSPSLRAAVRQAIDWETVTPLDELAADTLAARVKKGLRNWRESRRSEEAAR